MIKKHSNTLLFAFIIVGMFVSGWSLVNHYRKDASSACDVNRTFDCDIVNKSLYSEVANFPVAGIGLAGYMMLGIIAAFWMKERDPFMLKALILAAAGGLAFSLYLTYIEAYVLYTWCLLCLCSLSCITGVMLTSIMAKQKA